MAAHSTPGKYSVGLVQMTMSADPDANLRHAIAKVAEAAAAGAKVVCLPELAPPDELFDLVDQLRSHSSIMTRRHDPQNVKSAPVPS